jgi:hypothetical protein
LKWASLWAQMKVLQLAIQWAHWSEMP